MVENQAYLFLVFSLTGIIIGIIYDIFRVLRKSFKTSDIITYFEDILFWIISAIILLYTVIRYTTGELRIYMFVGLFLGILIYFKFFSKYIVRFFSNIIKSIISIIIKILLKILLPFNFFYKIFKKGWKKRNIML